MIYLEKAFKFLSKYYLLVVPFYILAAIPLLIGSAGTLGAAGNMMNLYRDFSDPSTFYENPMALFNMLRPIIFAGSFAAFVGFILWFLVQPATYGMINKALETDRADLSDFAPSLSQNIVKFILYWLGIIALWVVFGLAVTIIFVLLGLLTAIIKAVGVLLMVIAVLAVIAAAITLWILTNMWLPAMIVDNLDVLPALRKSIEVLKTNFWTLLGISLLLWLAQVIAGAIIGVLGGIPLIGALIISVVPAVYGFIMAVFYTMVYRDKTGKVLA
jgi:hypothetical protein